MNAISFGPELPDDINEVGSVLDAAFEDTLTSTLLDALRRSSAWRSLSFVARSEDRVVGHVSYTRGWIDARERLVEVLILSPMSVHPDSQGKGVGSDLIRYSLAQLQQREEPLVFLEGDPKFYSRVGFEQGIPAGFQRATVRTPEWAFQFVKLPRYESWMRGQLVYPDPFWEFDCAGLRD